MKPLNSAITQLSEMFDDYHGCVYIKDINLTYQYINRFTLEALKLKKNADYINKTDLDFVWAEFHELYQAHDLDTLENICYSQIDPIILYDGNKALALNMKKPIKDPDGNIIGILVLANIYQNHQLNELIEAISKSKNTTFKINAYPDYLFDEWNLNLTSREIECLFYTLQGRSAKTVANTLNLSAKSVEYHINNIKRKWNCNNKSELFEKAYSYGYFTVLPKSLFSHNSIEGLNESDFTA